MKAYSVLAFVLFVIPTTVFADVTIGGDRPTTLRVPLGYDPSIPTPLMLFLHGYGMTGAGTESMTLLSPLAQELGFLVAYPDGLVDDEGRQTWLHGGFNEENKTYLHGLIQEVIADQRFNVDRDRIVIAGYSNGGFMAYYMGCSYSNLIAAVISLAGANTMQCQPSAPVHALGIHGTDDTSVPYEWERLTIERWAGYNGCFSAPQPGADLLDLSLRLPGPDTFITLYEQGCLCGGSAELWSIDGGQHAGGGSPPNGATTNFAVEVTDWFLRHPKRPSPVASFTTTTEGGSPPLDVTVDGS